MQVTIHQIANLGWTLIWIWRVILISRFGSVQCHAMCMNNHIFFSSIQQVCAVSVIIHFRIGVAPDGNDCLSNGRIQVCCAGLCGGCKIYCPASRTTLVARRFRVAVICPIIQVPHCIRVFFYFVWFVFINHIFQFYYELCTYCNILDIYLS